MSYWATGHWADEYWTDGHWVEVLAGAEEAILDWVRQAFGVDEVIWIDQAAPRLAFPYITMRWFSDTEIGLAEQVQFYHQLALDVRERVEQTRRLTIQLEVYTGVAGDLATLEAMEVLETGLLHLQTRQIRELFRAARISFLSHEKPLRLDEFNGRRWERRALCDIHFLHIATTAPGSVGQIATAVVSLNITE